MRYARINNGIVAEISDFQQDPNGNLFHPSIQWVQTNTAQIGDSYTSGAFSPITLTPAQQWTAFQTSAQIALDKTDVTMTRIAEAVSLGLTTWTALDVIAWVQYRRNLRAILSQNQPVIIPATLPLKPAYPVGS